MVENQEQSAVQEPPQLLMFLAEQSQITPNDLEKLLYSGFDNEESLAMLDEDTLIQLQTEEDPMIIIQKVM